MVSYSLTAPNERAFDPSGLETLLVQSIGNNPALAPHLVAARWDRYNANRDYLDALASTQRQQSDLAKAAMANDILKSRYSLTQSALANPGATAMYSLSQQEIAPGMEQPALSYLEADIFGRQAKGAKDMGDALNTFGQAGLEMPSGTQYELPGVPAALEQGSPRAIRLKTTPSVGSSSGTTSGMTAYQSALLEARRSATLGTLERDKNAALSRIDKQIVELTINPIVPAQTKASELARLNDEREQIKQAYDGMKGNTGGGTVSSAPVAPGNSASTSRNSVSTSTNNTPTSSQSTTAPSNTVPTYSKANPPPINAIRRDMEGKVTARDAERQAAGLAKMNDVERRVYIQQLRQAAINAWGVDPGS